MNPQVKLYRDTEFHSICTHTHVRMYAYAKDKKEEAFTFLTVREMLEITTHDMKGQYKRFSISYGPHSYKKKSVYARSSKYTPKKNIYIYYYS